MRSWQLTWMKEDNSFKLFLCQTVAGRVSAGSIFEITGIPPPVVVIILYWSDKNCFGSVIWPKLAPVKPLYTGVYTWLG